MKSFNQLIVELNEVKFKIPAGSKELKRDNIKAGGKSVELVYVQNKKRIWLINLIGRTIHFEFWSFDVRIFSDFDIRISDFPVWLLLLYGTTPAVQHTICKREVCM